MYDLINFKYNVNYKQIEKGLTYILIIRNKLKKISNKYLLLGASIFFENMSLARLICSPTVKPTITTYFVFLFVYFLIGRVFENDDFGNVI